MSNSHDTFGELTNHCWNKKCYNFTTNQDLNGTWCCDECFIETESQNPRITRRELLEMKVDYDWDMDRHEKRQVQEMNITKSLERINHDR